MEGGKYCRHRADQRPVQSELCISRRSQKGDALQMTESALLHAIRLEAPKLGVTAWRNNVGRLRDTRGNFIPYGLCVGSSDIIGLCWAPEERRGKFLAIECKLPGKHPTKEQAAFIAAVKAAGGIAGVAHSIEEFRQIVSGG